MAQKPMKKSFFQKFGDQLEKIKSTAKKVASAPAKANKRYRKAQAQKEIDDVSRAFGSIDNYVKMYPDYAARAKRLKKEAYDN